MERHTHDYTRNGTLSLFAALEVVTGQVTNQARERDTGDDFLAFLRLPARTYQRGELLVVLETSAPTRPPTSRRGWRSIRAFGSTSPRPARPG